MLTYSKKSIVPRKDRPIILYLTVFVWIASTMLYHSAWEVYEPYIVAVVKSMSLGGDSWLTPHILMNEPYFGLKAMPFWIIAVVIKIFHVPDSYLTNAIRIIYGVLLFLTLSLAGRVGSFLPAYKSGRTVVMLMLSSFGFIATGFIMTPFLWVLIGCLLCFYALEVINSFPGRASIYLTFALILVSCGLDGRYLIIMLTLLLSLPFFIQKYKNTTYILSISISIALSLLILGFYLWQIAQVDFQHIEFWLRSYWIVFDFSYLFDKLRKLVNALWWIGLPSVFLMAWTIYKRKNELLRDSTIVPYILFAALVLLSAILLYNPASDYAVLPLLIPVIVIAALEVDSIRISFVDLGNWFSIMLFGSISITLILLFISTNYGYPTNLLLYMRKFAPDYSLVFDLWRFIASVIMIGVWVFMITRRQIRGREMVSNWANGTSLSLALFGALFLPWVDSVLSFQSNVEDSIPYVRKANCIATLGQNKVDSAIWYDYANIRLKHVDSLQKNDCNMAIVVSSHNESGALYSGYHVVRKISRSIDKKEYVILEKNI